MLGKIIKYDIKATYRIVLLVNIATLIMAGFAYLTAVVLGDSTNLPLIAEIIGTMVELAFVVLAVGSAFVTLFVPAKHFFRSVYGDEGYLTNTLPVKPRTIITGKALVFVLWEVVNSLVMLSFLIFGTLDDSADLSDIFGSLFQAFGAVVDLSPMIIVDGLLYTVFGLFLTVGLVYFSISLGSLFKSHRAIWSIVVGVVMVNLFQFVYMCGGVFAISVMEDHFVMINSVEAMIENLDVILFIVNVMLVLCYVSLAALFVTSERILAKRLNLL